jgi:uridine phosphorylase
MPARKKNFSPEHLNAAADDIAGNDGIGRYIFLPGSDGRAQVIAGYFDNLSVITHPRAHNLYLGTIDCEGTAVDVAVVSTGMGCASAEIILHELFQLGGKRFLRVGTAGSLQPELVQVGDLVNAQAAVRDESTTLNYAPLGFPAMASLEFTSSIMLAAEGMDLQQKLHTGIVQCKSSLYSKSTGAHLDQLLAAGVLAADMETSAIYILSQIYNHELQLQGNTPAHRVLSGAILNVVANGDGFDNSAKVKKSLQSSIELSLEAVRVLALQELIN